MTPTISIDVYHVAYPESTITRISMTDANGNKIDRRIFGSEYHDLGTTSLVAHQLDAHDAARIRSYLDVVFPAPPSDEITKLRAQIAKLEEDSRTLRALEAAGVDNWEGYSSAFNDQND